MKYLFRVALGLVCGALAAGAAAQDMGKLLATGGVSQVEGAGGGGLTPWALITGYGTRDSFGANLHYTHVRTQDYSLATWGVAVGIFDRVELSAATQEFRGSKVPLNSLNLKQDIYGIKVKVLGDAVYDQDRFLPQIAVGLQYKRDASVGGLGALGVTSVRQLGAADDKGIDYYVSATKILLDQSLLVSGTLRFTRANQFGLVGFGSAASNSRKAMLEGSAAYLFTRKLAAGVEFRQKPINLQAGLDQEKNAYDLFVAWFPTRNVSLTAAYVSLGDIVGALNSTKQKGPYLSLQVGF
jgi:hypothetical protein